MKKLLFLVAVSGLLTLTTGCFRSVETPIPGSDRVTYTVKDSDLVGIKVAGATTSLTDAKYRQVIFAAGYFLAQFPSTSAGTKWDLLDSVYVKPVTGEIYDNILVEKKTGAFILMLSGQDYYYLPKGAHRDQLVGPKQQFFVSDGLVFTKSGDKWGLNGVLDDKYDEIIVLVQNDGKEAPRYVVKNGKTYQLLAADGKVLKKAVTAKAVQRLEQLSKKYADQSWKSTTAPITRHVVDNIRTAI